MSLFSRVGRFFYCMRTQIMCGLREWVSDEPYCVEEIGRADGEQEVTQPQVHNFLFVDCAGTLFSRKDGLSFDRVAEAQALSAELGLEIIAWTGEPPYSGDWKKYRQQLRDARLLWPLESKQDYRGQIVAVAMDDDEEQALKDNYDITCIQYFRVDSPK